MKSPSNLKQIQIYGMVLEGTETSQLDEAINILKEAFYIQGQGDQLNISEFNDGNWKKVFSMAISVEYTILYLHRNKHEKIIMDISKPNFLKLQRLYLNKNKISSIEQLQFLNIPKLKELNLNYNQITKVNALNKCACNSLSWISLIRNPIHQIELQKMNTVIRIEKQFSDQNKAFVWIDSIRENSSILAKIKFNHFLWEDPLERNHSSALPKCLSQKGLFRYSSPFGE